MARVLHSVFRRCSPRHPQHCAALATFRQATRRETAEINNLLVVHVLHDGGRTARLQTWLLLQRSDACMHLTRRDGGPLRGNLLNQSGQSDARHACVPRTPPDRTRPRIRTRYNTLFFGRFQVSCGALACAMRHSRLENPSLGASRFKRAGCEIYPGIDHVRDTRCRARAYYASSALASYTTGRTCPASAPSPRTSSTLP